MSDTSSAETLQISDHEQSCTKRLTLSFRDASVDVRGMGEDFASTCYSVLTNWIPTSTTASTRRIINSVNGQVCPGEMLLVLGRPGSGCTSLLKIFANNREEFHAVTGDVFYGNMGPKQAKQFRHQIVMNTEDDLHFETLTVAETMKFAATTKLTKSRPKELHSVKQYTSHITDKTLAALGISHTKDTIVGSEFVRGVSGGERKRVSLAEVMATNCWDNSTRGLDASTSLDFARVLRKSADDDEKTIIATLYQAGNSIYNQFDKVLVLAEGRQIYYGPASMARSYFEDMGFLCPAGANIADFLTSVTVHTERAVRPGFEEAVPNTAEEFEVRYKQSDLCKQMLAAMETSSANGLQHEAEDLKLARAAEKNRTLGMLSREKSPYHVSIFQQVQSCVVRQVEILWGDRWSNALQTGSAIVIALVTGSLFYNLSPDSDSIFTRPGALFFPILLWGLNRMSEVTASFRGRPIVARQKRLAFNRPGAYALACTITDIPLIAIYLILYQIVYYFLVGFQVDAGKFFTNFFVYFVVTLCFSSLYRSIGAWCTHFGLASQISGLVTMAMMVYAGYLIPQPILHPWLGWIAWINPAQYAFQSVLASEMGSRVMECVEPQFVPFGPSYGDDAYRSCTIPGGSPGDNIISGAAYSDYRYNATKSDIWRDVGIIIAFWVFFAIMTALGFEVNVGTSGGSKILFVRRNQQKKLLAEEDSEKAVESQPPEDGDLSAGQTVFTFKDISYFVNHHGQELQLLDNVSGYIKPGQLVALMGSSGAGKTTLMDVLAQRKDSGRVTGSILVNGQPQGITFQRTTGYCEQNDVHEPTATVLESLIFSARLRQSYETPDAEKIQYVHRIMDLLELTPLQHAIVGSPGSGLSIEQRKRLTLATELVAKPSLLFLDEPTSGLDGQSAFEVCRFLRKLAASGQTIICTIHQPSAALFEAFDVLLLLARGGRTTYFGPTGKDSSIVLDYFARRGATAEPDVNPAEHIVDVVQGRFGTETDWPQQWLDSEERRQTIVDLDEINANQKPPVESSDEKASHQDFATPISYQVVLVTRRHLTALWRTPDYVWNKLCLHVSNALFGGFTFWMIGNGAFDLQLRLMSVFNFVFVAPGCINQMQPMFISKRDIFETREKKSKTYHWFAFVASQLISEIPVLVLCATLYFACWYFTCGFPVKASHSGPVYLQMILYEFLYTSVGQAIAAYSPNEYFAALANPLIIGAALINFCGVLVPYDQMQVFWRYWMYWLDPFTYLIGGLLEPVTWNVQVTCASDELTYIAVPPNSTCGEYMADFFTTNTGYVTDPHNTTMCAYCPYETGADYLRTININESLYGWRDIGITALFCISSYALVFLMMKLRTKATKTAS